MESAEPCLQTLLWVSSKARPDSVLNDEWKVEGSPVVLTFSIKLVNP